MGKFFLNLDKMWEEFWNAISCQACIDDLEDNEENYPMILKDLNKDQSFYRIEKQQRMSTLNSSKNPNLKYENSIREIHDDTDRYNKFSNFLDNSHGKLTMDFGKGSNIRPSHWTGDLNLSLSRIEPQNVDHKNEDM